MGKTGTRKVAQMFEPVLDQLDAQGTIDWSLYDSDNNGKLDLLLVIHSGFAAEQGIGGRCGAPDPMNRIVSQGHMGQNNGWWDGSLSVQVSGFALASAFDRVCDESNWASMSVMTHELLHTFRKFVAFVMG